MAEPEHSGRPTEEEMKAEDDASLQVPAFSCDRVLFKVVPQGLRLAFGEVNNHGGPSVYRTAVLISTQDVAWLHDTLGNLLREAGLLSSGGEPESENS